MHGSSIDEEDIAPDTILEGDIADGAVATAKLAVGVLSADAGGRALFAAGIFDVAATLSVFAAGAFTTANLDVLIADDQFTTALMNNLMVVGALADDRLASFLVKEPGHMAQGVLDFAAVATPAVTVTIGAVTYLEADAEDLVNGTWTNGASANDSAVSLAAAINGDTRNAGGASYAAVVVTDTVFVLALAIGTAGNVAMSVSAGEPVVIENMIGGTAAAVKQQAHIMHVVTAAEVAVAAGVPSVFIPLPFDVDFFSWQVYDSTGGIYATEITARGTVTNAAGNVPAYFLLADNGAADVQAGDIIRLVVQS